MNRKKPWNRVNLPVYSISSEANGKGNMNIITYATAVSMVPKRFICAVYRDTRTLSNVLTNPHFVLQLMSDDQHSLVKLLGKQTGKKTDKLARLQKKEALMQWNGFAVLKDALALMEMKVLSHFEGGDHICFLCEVTAYKNCRDGNVLTLDTLREKKIIVA